MRDRQVCWRSVRIGVKGLLERGGGASGAVRPRAEPGDEMEREIPNVLQRRLVRFAGDFLDKSGYCITG